MAGGKSRQIMAAIAACMGAFSLGTILGYTNNTGAGMVKDLELTEASYSWIGSVTALGALVSGPVTGYCIGRLGRKGTMLLLSAPFVLGWLLITYATSFTMALLGRLITGFCGGAFSLAAPVYVGETAEDDIRGTLGAGFQLMVVMGITFAYVVGMGVSWEWLALISGFAPLIFLVMMIFPPESPRYLIGAGKTTEAFESLKWLRPAKSNEEVESELKLVQDSVDEEKRNKATFKDLLKGPMLKPTMIGLGLMFFQQLSGINAVIFYSTQIFDAAGVGLASDVSSVLLGCVQIVATIISSLLMDRLGRRVLLLLSDVAMGICLVALGIFFWLKEQQKHESIGWLPLGSLMIFIVAFSLGYGPIPWLMMGELLPPKVKGLASALCTSFNWTLAFLVTKFFQDALNAFTPKWCYWGFAIVCGIGTIFVFIFVPETKGKSLDEIQEYFGAKKPDNSTQFAAERGDANRH